jgi:predicted nucleic acid-binding protein
VAKAEVVLALDSGALILAEKDQRIEAVIRKWVREGARVIIPAPCLAECIRGGARDAAANRIIGAVSSVANTTESIARDAGRRLSSKRRTQTIDALIVATAEANGATDILTTDPVDIRSLATAGVNIIGL